MLRLFVADLRRQQLPLPHDARHEPPVHPAHHLRLHLRHHREADLHNITYVLAVYIFNLLAVSTNLLVYFRNKKLDNARNATSHKSESTKRAYKQKP